MTSRFRSLPSCIVIVATICCSVLLVRREQQGGYLSACLLLVQALASTLELALDVNSRSNGVPPLGVGIIVAVFGPATLIKILGITIFLSATLDQMLRFWPSDESSHATNVAGSSSRRITTDPLTDPRETTRESTDALSTPLLPDGDTDEENPMSNSSRLDSPGLEYGDTSSANESQESNGLRDEGETVTPRIQGTRRLLNLAGSQMTALYAGCAVLCVRLPCSLAMPHLVSECLTAVGEGNYDHAIQYIVQLAVVGTIDAGLDFWGFFLFGFANQNIVKSLRVSLFAKLLGHEVAFFDRNESSQLASRLSGDCSEMAGDLTWFFRFSIESVIRITGIAGYMLVRSPLLAAACLSIVAPVAIINKFYGDWLRQNAIKVQDALAEANAVAQEALYNIRTVMSFCGEQRELTNYEKSINRQYNLNIQQLFLTALYYMVVSTFLINTVVQASLLYFGLRLVQSGNLKPGVLLAFTLYQSQLQNELLNLMNSYTSLIKSSGAGEKVFSLLDRNVPPPGTDCVVDDPPLSARGQDGGQSCPETLRCIDSVSFEEVTFAYPSRPDTQVLDNFNLKLKCGSTFALVGKSGCGKSTIVQLLQRFYDPDKGRVIINDGPNLRDIPILDHRRRLGVVSQDPALFHGTLFENLVYGQQCEVSESRVMDALRLAHADTFVNGFPNGLSTQVGERGLQLSGGQKQRIAIARAILNDTNFLILDEATSALDGDSENAIQAALEEWMNPTRTILIIAHRLRTIRNADSIVVLQEGGIIAEQGTHDELMQSCGVYRNMVENSNQNDVIE